MYDISKLENKWHKYKKDKIKKALITTGVITVAILGISVLVATYILNKKTDNKIEKKENNQTIIKKLPNSNKVTDLIVDTNKNIDIYNSTIDLSRAEIVKPNIPDDEIRVIGFNKKEENRAKKRYKDILAPKGVEIDTKEKEKSTKLEDKFKLSQNTQDSLAIAKYYYKKGNYKKAENWAINTNNLDSDIEESWLIFAKARAKQGFRVDAIKVLQSYYDETKSNRAKELLIKLRFGKSFK